MSLSSSCSESKPASLTAPRYCDKIKTYQFTEVVCLLEIHHSLRQEVRDRVTSVLRTVCFIDHELDLSNEVI